MFVFISTPMKGFTNEQINEKLKLITAKIEEHFSDEAPFIKSGFFDLEKEPAPDDVNKPLWCFSRSLRVMSECDTIVLTEDFLQARGCRLEHIIAQAYGLDVYIIDKKGKINKR